MEALEKEVKPSVLLLCVRIGKVISHVGIGMYKFCERQCKPFWVLFGVYVLLTQAKEHKLQY